HWGNGTSNAMYATYDYNQGQNITITLTNLLAGSYDVYLYGHGPSADANGVYNLAVDSTSSGTQSTTNGAGWDSPVWREGVQYVVFRAVSLTNAAQVLKVTVSPGASGYSLISGLQLVSTTPQGRPVLNLSQNQNSGAGRTVVLSLGGQGTNSMAGSGLFISAFKHTASGGSQFELNGVPGQSYAVQFSADLVTWTTIMNVTMTNSAILFSDPTTTTTTNTSNRFYRLRSQ
ncbi:MAG: Immunoglobulin I-set domain protein, partial [Pedosphaera sp.]|nr:Immunoglobulin I-set domain protein [Pedosphaera sp.]